MLIAVIHGIICSLLLLIVYKVYILITTSRMCRGCLYGGGRELDRKGGGEVGFLRNSDFL